VRASVTGCGSKLLPAACVSSAAACLGCFGSWFGMPLNSSFELLDFPPVGLPVICFLSGTAWLVFRSQVQPTKRSTLLAFVGQLLACCLIFAIRVVVLSFPAELVRSLFKVPIYVHAEWGWYTSAIFSFASVILLIGSVFGTQEDIFMANQEIVNSKSFAVKGDEW
jgi:hypothetical protein